jgi:hypothetical protein
MTKGIAASACEMVSDIGRSSQTWARPCRGEHLDIGPENPPPPVVLGERDTPRSGADQLSPIGAADLS